MLEYMTLWALSFAVATSVINLRTFNKLVEHIKLTDNARENMNREKRMYEKMNAECEVARDSYNTRLATLDKAETIAAFLAGKGESDV